MPTWMSEAKVHNYAFRKLLAYVKNKRGKKERDSIQQIFENSSQSKISTRSPYLPTYHPIKSFILLLQIVKNRFGDTTAKIDVQDTDRCYDVGFYLYVGSEEKDSPYHYLDPHKSLEEVLTDFYNNLNTPSAIFKDCGTKLTISDSKIMAVWKECEGNDDFFHYLDGVHAGMIKASIGNGRLFAKKEGDIFVFEIHVLE